MHLATGELVNPCLQSHAFAFGCRLDLFNRVALLVQEIGKCLTGCLGFNEDDAGGELLAEHLGMLDKFFEITPLTKDVEQKEVSI